MFPTRCRSSVCRFKGGCALRDGGEQRRLGDTSCGARDPDGPRRRPPACTAAKVKWGWDAAAPPVPPLRARGAQRWPGPRGGGRAPPPAPLVRSSRKCAPRPGDRPSLLPCVLCPNPGALGTRGQAGHRAAAGRLGALGAAAATARLRWNASPPASWKPLLALGLQPGLVPGAPAAAAAGSALGRRSLRSGPAGPARLVQGCHSLPAPPTGLRDLGC